MCDILEKGCFLVGYVRLGLLVWVFPSRVQQLPEVKQRQSLVTSSPASKVEDDGRLHGREEGIARARGGVVEEVGLVYPSVL